MSSILNDPRLRPVPAYLLATQLLLGGIVRASPFPFREAHDDVCRKNERVAPLLYPFVPFKDFRRHNAWVSGCMITAGGLLLHPFTRGKAYTLCLVWYLTAGLAYSHYFLGMTVMLPLANSGLAFWNWMRYTNDT